MNNATPPGPVSVLNRPASPPSEVTGVKGGVGEQTTVATANGSGRGAGRLGLLIMAITLLILVFLAGFGTWSLRQNRTTGRNEARQGVLRSARVASTFGATLVNTAQSNLALIAASPAVVSAQPAQMEPYFQRLKSLGLTGIFSSGISWIAPNGQVEVSSSNTGTPSVNVSDREYFRTALSGRAVLSPGLRGRLTNAFVLVFAAPTHALDGSVTGVITGAVQLAPIDGKLLKGLFGTANLTAYDSSGQLIIGPPGSHLGSATPASLVAASKAGTDGLLPPSASVDKNGQQQVIAFAKVPNAAWLLAVRQPATELDAAIDHQYDRSLALLLTLSVASFLGAAFAASKLDGWHRRVADERARLAAVIDRLPAGVAVVGSDARIEMANEPALEALGALGGSGAATAVGADVPPAVAARLGEDGHDDDIAIVVDGVERFFAVKSTPIGHRRGASGAVTLVEETTSRQADERRRVAAADLLAAISVADVEVAIAQTVVDRSRDAIGCDRCAVITVSPDDGRLVTLAGAEGDGAASDGAEVDDRGGDDWRDALGSGSDDDRSAVGRAVAEQRLIDLVGDADAPDSLGRIVVLPLQSAGRAVGAVALGYRDAAAPVDLAELTGLAAQVALAIDRARRREIEHDVSLTLQRTLLASAPVHEVDLSIALRYQPAADQMLVGGDFYDVIALDGLSHLLLIGDVVGHGLDAATTMGQLKIAIRAFAQETRSPARILSKLDEFVSEQLTSARYSTAALVVVDRADGVLRAAVAGHPPPLLRHSDGSVTPLPVVQQPLLGLPPAGGRTELETPLAPGATGLCLYTDGLIERPDLLLDDGIARLSSELSRSDGWDVERTAEQLMALVGAGPHRDDIALLYALIHT